MCPPTTDSGNASPTGGTVPVVSRESFSTPVQVSGESLACAFRAFLVCLVLLSIFVTDATGQESRFVETAAPKSRWIANRYMGQAPTISRVSSSQGQFPPQDGSSFPVQPAPSQTLVDPQTLLQGLNLSQPETGGAFRSQQFREQGDSFNPLPTAPLQNQEPIQPAPFSLDNVDLGELRAVPEANSNQEAASNSSPPPREQLGPPAGSAPRAEDENRDGSADLTRVPDREIITENYPDGKPRIYRSVKLDAQGNYVNDGPWRVVNRAGETVAQGNYRNGLMDGVWGRRHPAREGGLFGTSPFTSYTGPFDSYAKFQDGRLHGQWVIYDQLQRKVFEVGYRNGVRHGTATWYYPNRQKMREAQFNDGVLDGEVLEWDNSADHRLVSQKRYLDGRQVVRNVTSYRPNLKQSEATFLDRRLEPEGIDNWWEAKPTPFVASGLRIQQGPVAAWYSNQQLQYRGQYRDDHPVGQFTWWHENGNRKTIGFYNQQGERDGEWIWWHDNGMKKIQGRYKNGQPTGEWKSWLDDGTLRKELDYDDPSAAKPTTEPLPIDTDESDNDQGVEASSTSEEASGVLPLDGPSASDPSDSVPADSSDLVLPDDFANPSESAPESETDPSPGTPESGRESIAPLPEGPVEPELSGAG